MVVKIGIIKSGNIGTSPVLDLLLDERADRPNIDVRVFGSGAKMNPEQVEDVVPKKLINLTQISVSSLVQTQEHLDQLKQENCYLKKTSRLLSLVMHQVKVKKMKWMNKA